MQKKIYAFALLFLIVLISTLIVILPTFFTKGVSRMELHKEINLPLLLNDDQDVKIVFFGYSGCVDVCTPRLHAVSALYDDLSMDVKKRVGVDFLDVSSPQNKKLPSDFAKLFNKEFNGVYLDDGMARVYAREFNVYFSKGLIDKTEYDHTSNLYLIKRRANKKEIRYVYSSFPYDLRQIQIDIEELLHE